MARDYYQKLVYDVRSSGRMQSAPTKTEHSHLQGRIACARQAGINYASAFLDWDIERRVWLAIRK